MGRKLIGNAISLVPLETEHIDKLSLFSTDPEIWRYLSMSLDNRDEVQEWCLQRQLGRQDGKILSFVIEDNLTTEVVGYTGIFDLDTRNKIAEVGPTWLNPRYFGHKINLEAKLLLLSHAFEEMKLNRLQFKTDEINLRSQRAILKLDAKLEGVLRSYKIRKDGSLGNYLIYSTIASEWPATKELIKSQLK